VAVSAIVVLVAAYRLVSRRADLIRYAWMVVAGTLTQVVLGGITVLLDLHPVVVGVHFLLSMGLLAASEMLWIASGTETGKPVSGISGSGQPGLGRWLIRSQMVLATVVLFTGTIVTGTGPNSGDSRADRLDFELESVARIHAVTVWLLLALLVVIALRLTGRLGGEASPGARPSQGPRYKNPFDVVQWMLGVVVLQGAIGYTQFALGVPPLLVELHIMGAVAVWSLAILLTAAPVGATVPVGETAGRNERLADLA
ncbi:MAG: COX15/CtaA family protein, partial [Acidimicrobiales bacterium]